MAGEDMGAVTNVAVSPLNVLAICAGVGGLELGLQLAHPHLGRTVRGGCYVEREAAAAASLVSSMEAGWFHHAPVWSDARTFDGTAFRGCVDIVTSGDPCQGNSVAGKRRGELDDRWLLDRAIDIFDQSGADTFFRENVPGNADGQLAVAIPSLERLGCRVAVGIFSSAETGNTMRRERLFILAHRASPGLPNSDGAGASSTRQRDAEPERRGLSLDGAAHCDGRLHPRSGRSNKRAADVGGSGRAILPPAVIPGPADNRGWIDVLDRFPEYQPALSQEEAQSHLRRGIDAMADRIERLRATGNGVDPVAAATAYLRLDALLAADRCTDAAFVRIAA